jgi:hypothetical protein
MNKRIFSISKKWSHILQKLRLGRTGLSRSALYRQSSQKINSI